MPDVERQSCLPGNNVGCPGLRLDLTYRRHQTGYVSSHALDCGNPLRRSGKGVVSKMHGRRAGVIAAANECELQPALPRDGVNDRKRLSQLFQNWSLLNVKLNVSKVFAVQTRLRNLCRIQTKLFDSLLHRSPLAVLNLQQFFIEPAHKSPAADERYSETN